ncbi:hypothetical protein LTR37_020015 [Vermiconidia calcicola]|uniref:Uncharacterized protein n=1 Tax=Vermiconidia calcicola TaxID=1690605 RepID=A0ACC3MDP4_9PEZI|nr:hypothetical protein LTR37_020015 [Vermiconidia calcicola]
MTGGLEKSLQYSDTVPLPSKAASLPENSVLVRVAYASLNPVDYKLPETALLRVLGISKPGIPCGDFVGTVVSTTMPGLRPGDRVFGSNDPSKGGALAEYMVLSGRENVVPLSEGENISDAATLGVAGLTAYQCLQPYVKEGSKVFINGGSGGVGIFSIQIAKKLGCIVTTTCSGPNVEFCKSLGADDVVDYRTVDVVEHLKRQGTQYDLLIDNVNTPSIYYSAHHYLKPEGRFITIAGSPDVASVISMLKMFCLPTWLGGGQRRAQFLLRKSDAEGLAKMAEWVQEGSVKAVVEKIYELDQAGEAFARMKSGRTRGKLVVKVAGE